VTALSAATLPSLADAVPVPGYDRSRVRTGIVHFGVGGFHRAHEAMYLDRLMNAGSADTWGICGVGVLPGDRRMKDALAAQDGLYTLVVKHPDGSLEPRVVGSIVEYLFAPDDPEAVLEKMADPSTRIVSLTVTEGGYNVHPVTGQFDAADPAVVQDLQPGAVPATVFGLVTEALARRRERGLPPFTVMSCDNIPGNGEVARAMFGAFARLRDPELGAWLEREVRFPNSMVDRITPVTSDDDRAVLAERFGVEDAWPVVCEPFTQWVLEDSFGDGRPPWEDVGAQLVEDVEPYELMKLRLLNASHQALCYLGYLSGYRYVHEVCHDPLFTSFLLAYMDREATPTLPPVPGVDLDAYKHTLIERFANPEVRDTLARLCAESSDRIPKWLLPVVRQQLATDGDIHRAALVVASWARYAEGVDEQGEPIQVVDRKRDPLMAAAARQREDPTAFLQDRDLFGDLADDARFVAAYTAALDSLHTRGARATLEALPA
jgi:mannitol 2-dehydrogenase